MLVVAAQDRERAFAVYGNGQCRVSCLAVLVHGSHMSRLDDTRAALGNPNSRNVINTQFLLYRFPPFIGGSEDGSNSVIKNGSLPAGNYEWPFEYILPGNTAESVEGLPDTHILYKLKATVARGRLAYDLHVYKPVRIIRTLSPAALELSHAMTVENVWPEKIEYRISIPQKAVIFGTSIHVDMQFVSLLKGLRLGTIKSVLEEAIELTVPAGDGITHRLQNINRRISKWSLETNPDEHFRDMLDETGREGYVMSQDLKLPKSLKVCVQDVDAKGIKVRHKLRFVVALHNPDEHVSEVCILYSTDQLLC